MKNFKIELRWAILFSFILMIEMFFERYMGWHEVKYIASQYSLHYLVLIVLFGVVYYFGIKEKRKNYYEGFINWKQAFISGAMISVIVAILSPLTQFFIYHYITPNYFKNMITYQVSKADNPLTKAGAQDIFNMTSFVIQGIFTCLSLGLIVSGAVALIVRKEPKEKK